MVNIDLVMMGLNSNVIIVSKATGSYKFQGKSAQNTFLIQKIKNENIACTLTLFCISLDMVKYAHGEQIRWDYTIKWLEYNGIENKWMNNERYLQCD